MREAVTYLDLEITVVPCARGSRHREHVAAAAKELLGKDRPSFPYLEDDAAGVCYIFTMAEDDAARVGCTTTFTMVMLTVAVLCTWLY